MSRTGKDVFGDAIELPAAEREEFVRRECGGDETLLAEVRRLLAAHGSSPGFLRMPTLGPPGSSALTERPGSVIGKYRLLERIGEGGFGVVFIAEQTDPVTRRVALKVLKPGMDTRAVIARFEAERQALAVMDHPNIARVLDGGATDSGRPYFVMELVTGRPITEYCDEHRLTIPQRLELFTQVCRAVQHAHQKGVIHRDINPRNVLVGERDGSPTARVIDFGIAKAVGREPLERSVFTEQGQIIGTPEYMSPEQAAGGPDIDTRTDVYSLGVLLYELLTGTTPFDPHSLRSAAFDELRRIIREDEPLRPSTRVSRLEGALAEVAAQRGVDGARLGTMIRGELDWIALKALEKDRARRYHSPEGLAADVHRYLSGAAVEAAPPGRVYRVSKFIRRHRLGVGAGAMVAIALAGGLGVSLWQASVAAHQRDTARKAAKEALDANAEAQAQAREKAVVASFQASQLKGIDVAQMGGRLRESLLSEARAGMERSKLPPERITLRQDQLSELLTDANLTNVALRALDENIFERALKAVDERFKDHPVIRAGLLVTLGETLLALGLHERAAGPLTEALEIRRRAFGDDDRATLQCMSAMATLLRAQGKMAEAEECLRDLVARHKRASGESDELTLNEISNLALVLRNRGKLTEAAPLLEDVLARRRATLAEDDPDLIRSVGNMGVLLQAQGRYAEAEPYFREAVTKHRKVRGNDDPDTMRSISNLGAVLQSQGKLEEAEPLLTEALVRRRRVLGESHLDTLSSMSRLGVLLDRQERRREAELCFAEVLAKSRERFGSDHWFTLQAIGNLGGLLRKEGRLAEAEPLLEEVLERDRRIHPPDHPDTLITLCKLAELRMDQKRAGDAERLFGEALAGALRRYGPAHPMVPQCRLGVGRAQIALGRYADAEAALTKAEEELQGDRSREGHKQCLRRLVTLYEAWETAEPGKGHAISAQQWKSKLTAAPTGASGPQPGG